MLNPILQQMQGKQNSLLDIIRSRNPIQAMIQANPQFKTFYEQNKNLPIDEVCRRYGVNPSDLERMIGNK